MRHASINLHMRGGEAEMGASYFERSDKRPDFIAVTGIATSATLTAWEGSRVMTQVEVEHRPTGTMFLSIAQARELHDALTAVLATVDSPEDSVEQVRRLAG